MGQEEPIPNYFSFRTRKVSPGETEFYEFLGFPNLFRF
jgi:hypothetical protein